MSERIEKKQRDTTTHTHNHNEQDNLSQSTNAMPDMLKGTMSGADAPFDPTSITPENMIHLQQTIGNQAVQRMINQQSAQGDTKPKIQRNWFTDAIASVGNAIGDALNIRENEAALDLWEDYQSEVKAQETFSEQSHVAENFQSTTRLGMFDATYNPGASELKIVCKSKFNFINGTATEFPDAAPEDLVWEDDKKEEWKNNFLSACSTSWSGGGHTFYCQKDWWEPIKAKVKIEFTSVTENEHFGLKIKKIPAGGFDRSSVGRPRVADDGTFTPGTGNFDSEDLTTVNKPGGQQQAAVHEAGHMLGLDDEYGTGTPDHSDLVESEFGHGVARGSDGRIMSGGTDIQPEHGVTFLEALKEATGMSEWANTQKEPKPIPPDPALMNMGDFPTPDADSDTQFA